MNFYWNSYVLVGVLNAVLALLVLVGCWPSRSVPAAKPLIVMLASVALWALFGSLEMAAVGMSAKIFWNTWLYIPILVAPASYLVFAMSYTGKGRWLNKPFYTILALPGVAIFLAALTNRWHGWLWSSFAPTDNNILVYGHGPFFWFGLVIYTYILFLLASALLLRAALLFPKAYRAQAILVVISSLIPFLGSIFYLFGISPVYGMDLTPLYLAGSGTLMGLGVLRMKLLDLLPVARASLVESMSDGMIVFDHRQRVLDFNSAAKNMVGNGLRLGSRIQDFSTAWNALQKKLECPHSEKVEIFLPAQIVLEAQITPLPVPGYTTLAHIVMLRDISHIKQVENALRDANERLQEQAVRDALTGLYNRRFLMDALPRELARAQRDKKPLAVALMDIDHFKRLNDEFGHQAGDAMLVELGLFLKGSVRREDLACRYGGEEFVLILSGASEAAALQRAEQIREAFAARQVTWKNQTLQATVSIGVACFPDQADGDARLLHCADQALYAAKQSGRNCCVGASSIELRSTAMFETIPQRQ